MDKKVSQWIRPGLLAQKAYHVPEPGDLIKLDAMENPYTWPKELVEEWHEVLKTTPVNRYPDPAAKKLCAVLRDKMSIPAELDLVLGNGSDESIQMILMSISQPGRTIVSTEPAFVMYKIVTELLGMNYESVALDDDFELDDVAMLATIEKTQPAVVFLAYPNNPTGNLFKRESVEKIIKASTGLVVIDEAYHAFAGDSFMGDLNRYENVLLLRTVSKLGLAGIRLGMLIGPKQWLQEINKTRLPYNINVLTQVSGEFAMRHSDMLEQQTLEICRQREIMLANMGTIAGVRLYPTKTNFILFRVGNELASKVFEHLKSSGILIKNMHGSSPQLKDCLRVTVGTEQQNEAFLSALKSAPLQ